MALDMPVRDQPVAAAREEWNRAYYGQTLSVEDIVLHNKAANPGAAPLKQALGAR